MGMASCVCCCFHRFFILWSHCAFSFVLLFACCWFSNSFDIWVWYILRLVPSICVCIAVCLRHWITYLILLCLYASLPCALFWIMWSDFCYPFLKFECCHFLHIMVMVDCLIDSYFWICVSLCSIALSPLCCPCRFVHFSFDGGLFGSVLS